MTVRLSLAIRLAAAAMVLWMPHSAIALDKKGVEVAPKRPAKMSPTNLSEGECTQLGGSVGDIGYGICNSGRACVTLDENKNRHVVCISKR